jgi:flagellar protein FlgJ
MFDQQLTQNLSGRGVGLAEAMLAQLRRTLPSGRPTPKPTPASA